MAGTADDKEITEFFTQNSPENICHFFKSASERHEKMAVKMSMICCNIIVIHKYQCHIYNDAMNRCLAEYDQWSTHVSGGDKSITQKMNDNCIILNHQIKQMRKYEQASNSDKWKRKIDKLVQKTEYEDFISLFSGMYFL